MRHLDICTMPRPKSVYDFPFSVLFHCLLCDCLVPRPDTILYITLLWHDIEQEVSTVEEFVYLGALIHSSTHSSTDILRWSAFTRTAMQNLDKQLWWSRISLSTKLRLYNTCILPIFLHGSECWAITKEDARRISALHQWCHRMLLVIKWYHFISNDEV